MASPHSPLFAVSTHFQRIVGFFTWFLLLAQVRGHYRSREVEVLLNFKRLMTDNGTITDDGQGLRTYINAGGYWSTWKETDDTPCGWVGVTCHDANSTVARLDFSYWGLQYLVGFQPLSNLTNLRELDLSSNNFGSIAEDIQFLNGLTHLDLSQSGLQGTIPVHLAKCQTLQYLSLEHNQLSGGIPRLDALVDLRVLLLADNQLTGGFPLELGQISSLVRIDLSDNVLNGTIPSLSKLTNLLHLKLDNNNFVEFEGPLFPGAKTLEHLSVSGNQLEGMIPFGITQLPNLIVLNMSHNRLLGDIPHEFSLPPNMPNSFSLDLSDNQLTGTISASLLQRASVMSVNLSHNLLTGSIPFDTNSTHIYYFLDLSNNNLSGLVPPFFNDTGNGKVMISSLCLQNNFLSGDIMELLVPRRRYDFIPGELIGLVELRLGNNLFTGDLSRIASINNSDLLFHRFEIVDISNNNLRMSTTQATDPLSTLLEFFTAGTRVKEFYVGGNNFSEASLPAHFSEYATSTNTSSQNVAENLEVLDLSNSHLKGEISGAVFNNMRLPVLQFLNLSNNDATGSVPESIFALSKLQVLDVTNNKLSGRLPTIPLNSRLYNPSFFANNRGLCGDPLPSCSRGLFPWWGWVVVVGCVILVVGNCFLCTYKLRVCRHTRQQDVDLITTLLERESTALMRLRDLRKATDNFSESARIGEGGFGIVYKGKLNDGTIVAIKKSKQMGSDNGKQQFLNEVRILSQVNHRNLVRLLGCCMEDKIAALVFEFICNGTLQEHLRGKSGVRLTWNQRLHIAVQTADALYYLHSAATFPIYHRDVKSANILLDSDLNAKVADFGISRLAPLQATHVSTKGIHGTMGYIDPEYYTTYQLTDKSDVYSFGMVLLELISAKPPLDSDRGADETSLAAFASPHIRSGDLLHLIDPALVDVFNCPTHPERESILDVGRLAMKCLEMRASGRPSMNEVCKELQNLWIHLRGPSIHLESIIEGDEYPQDDPCVPRFESFRENSIDTSSLLSGDSVIEMSDR